MKTPERPKSRKGDQRDIREINRDTTDDATVQELEDFDWEDFETRYHEAIKKQDEAQKKLYEDFRNLLRFFSNWVNCAVEHENRRSLKRLKTRMAYVQNAEDGLKERREHYTKVVQAFESALALLGT
ncbi:MAG: hypothetical protein M1817_005107 [Caeruleum heppii]|nr:MAG: hypothetical protein M1817_005107 [Caeruleum heppii]